MRLAACITGRLFALRAGAFCWLCTALVIRSRGQPNTTRNISSVLCSTPLACVQLAEPSGAAGAVASVWASGSLAPNSSRVPKNEEESAWAVRSASGSTFSREPFVACPFRGLHINPVIGFNVLTIR
jgi:hypothetical protein